MEDTFTFLDSWLEEDDLRIRSVVSRNFASLPGSVPMALAILAAGPSNLVVLGGAFLLCEEDEDEEEPDEWWVFDEGVEPALVKYLLNIVLLEIEEKTWCVRILRIVWS